MWGRSGGTEVPGRKTRFLSWQMSGGEVSWWGGLLPGARLGAPRCVRKTTKARSVDTISPTCGVVVHCSFWRFRSGIAQPDQPGAGIATNLPCADGHLRCAVHCSRVSSASGEAFLGQRVTLLYPDAGTTRSDCLRAFSRSPLVAGERILVSSCCPNDASMSRPPSMPTEHRSTFHQTSEPFAWPVVDYWLEMPG